MLQTKYLKLGTYFPAKCFFVCLKRERERRRESVSSANNLVAQGPQYLAVSVMLLCIYFLYVLRQRLDSVFFKIKSIHLCIFFYFLFFFNIMLLCILCSRIVICEMEVVTFIFFYACRDRVS